MREVDRAGSIPPLAPFFYSRLFLAALAAFLRFSCPGFNRGMGGATRRAALALRHVRSPSGLLPSSCSWVKDEPPKFFGRSTYLALMCEVDRAGSIPPLGNITFTHGYSSLRSRHFCASVAQDSTAGWAVQRAGLRWRFAMFAALVGCFLLRVASFIREKSHFYRSA